MLANCEKFSKHELENLFGLFGLPFRKSKTKKDLCAELIANLLVKDGVKRVPSIPPKKEVKRKGAKKSTEKEELKRKQDAKKEAKRKQDAKKAAKRKPGMEIPMTANVIASRSCQRPRYHAATVPSVTPRLSAITRASNPSTAETGNP